MAGFDGLGMNLGTLARLSRAKSRSLSAENFTGEKGAGGMATEGRGATHASPLGGQGWKVSPCISIEPGEVREIADIEGPGAIQQIWMTPDRPLALHASCASTGTARSSPSVECPVGDFFACGWGKYAQVTSLRGVREPGQRASTATGRCPSASTAASPSRTSRPRR